MRSLISVPLTVFKFASIVPIDMYCIACRIAGLTKRRTLISCQLDRYSYRRRYLGTCSIVRHVVRREVSSSEQLFLLGPLAQPPALSAQLQRSQHPVHPAHPLGLEASKAPSRRPIGNSISDRIIKYVCQTQISADICSLLPNVLTSYTFVRSRKPGSAADGMGSI